MNFTGTLSSEDRNFTNLTLIAAPRNVTYCDLKDVRKAFAVYYPYLSLIICIFGSVTNVLNICVLTSKQMRCPTNFILTGFAFANLLVMLEYIPFVFWFNENKAYASHFTYSLAVFVICHAVFSQALHFISCCLTVILAIWQYIAVKFPQNNNKWCSGRNTKITILLTYILCSVVCIPLNLSLQIAKHKVHVDKNGIINNKDKSLPTVTIHITSYVNGAYQYASSYVYAIAIKLIPSILLTVLSSLLIVELLHTKERKKKLMNPKKDENTKMRKPSQKFLEKEKQTDRTTRMLLVLLLLFLTVEFPQAIFGLLNVVIGQEFEMQCYQPLGDIVDVLTLTNFSINFILYCIMSKKFRMVFKESFFPYIPCSNISKNNWISLNTLQTYV